MPPILTGLPLSVAALATSPITEKMLDGMTVGFEDSVTVATLDGITVGFEDRVNVPDETEIAEDGITVKLLDGVTVAFDESVTPTRPPTVESATTMADMVEVTALDPADTQAVFAPLMIETAPDETEVIDGNDERMTVGLLESVTVPLLIDSALEMANDGALESVTVQTLDGITVGFEDSVIMPLLIARALEIPTETDSGPSVESATTSAAMVDVTALEPATTLAWLAPPAPPRIETWLVPLMETGFCGDSVTTSADMVDVAALDAAVT
jgi:hypothetical protein